ncbi:hypothetical protein M3223_18830 [Paenibacillus pasadenensis]|uniref:WD40 repeat domain-containing protein n=1 Tax=Paenibacillus pasadenensis TaxID=217090 RepID=UPI00203EC513|nr:WD40 repeat domain-containing protein [Paenibacillus pasadenensis]MCM3749410.1 hypothetical protein [Paenibacillus pasadenensis]
MMPQQQTRRFIMVALSAAALVSSAAYGYAKAPETKTVGKQASVKDNKPSSSALKEIKTLELDMGWSGLGWQAENKLFLTKASWKKHDQLPKKFNDLFTLNISNPTSTAPEKWAKAIAAGKEEISQATLSPDKKHLFYVERSTYESQYGTAKIINLQTGKVLVVVSNYVIEGEGLWLNNDSIVFIGGGSISEPGAKPTSRVIYRYDMSYGKEIFVLAKADRISNLEKSGDKLYYQVSKKPVNNKMKADFEQIWDSQMKSYDLNTKKENVITVKGITRKMEQMIPSPDGSRFLIVTNNSALVATGKDSLNKYVIRNDYQLYLTEAKGGTPKKVAAGDQFLAASWSPEGNTIAYHMSDFKNLENNKIRLLDVKTGKTQLIGSIIDRAMQLSWSPSGTKLLITNAIPIQVPNGTGQAYYTSIVSFK